MHFNRASTALLLTSLTLVVSTLVAVRLGSVNLPLSDPIVWNLRLPRIILGIAVGAGLAIAGCILQAVMRNVLADPYIVGVHSGASCGAATVLLFGTATGASVQLSAFLGALVATTLIFVFSRTGGQLTSSRLLLAGVAIGYAFSAVTSFMVFASDSPEASRSVMFWLLGSLSLAQWDTSLALVFVVLVLSTAILTLIAPRIDALALGDTTALSLGINPSRFRAVLLLIACLLIGSVVALSGAIGFVGLVVPHFARHLVGARHRATIPLSGLLGALLIVWADVGARTLLPPQEIPIGIITALMGTPFLLFLIRRHRSLTESM
ncbi:FecCD family ABC transporter permease [Corynebacterium auriscanis]|uniref:FecCD family ABC transporter permease n=1 Tax=Corynebacterium auriscanis TaxID=99807 RepID=UPI0022468CBA|nr:iron ABC transporter permease [Corynebacterium auriscanis]MCX2162656.1 iron ABC transporter permease [Corynebacterium auriscanis]